VRVCIDIQAAVTQQAGVGRYVKSLVQRLGDTAGSDALALSYFDFMRRGIPFNVPGAATSAIRWIPGRFVQKAWKTIAWPPFDLLAGAYDVYHFPNFIIPPIRKGGKTVVTIHDTAFLRMPETTEEKNLRYLKAGMADTVERADAIIAVSRFTADEIAVLFNAERARIHAVHSGISDCFAPAPADKVDRDLKALGIKQPFILTVGTIEPRKNIPFLVEFYEKMDKFKGQLVIAGMAGWKCSPIFDRMRRSTRSADIKYVSYLTDSLLPSLYTGADLFAFPSRYEGFGFPPLEAMACGTPVLAAATGSLPEILGNAATLIAGFDSDRWADEAMKRLGDRSNSAGARAHATGYSWAETARQTWNVYRKVAGCA